MPKVFVLLLLIAAVVGGWYFFQHYELKGLDQLRLQPRGGQPPAAQAGASQADSIPTLPPPNPRRESIRIASFNLGRFDQNKLSSARVREVLGQLISRFDLVAVQDIHAANQGILMRLVEQINASQRYYDFATCPSVGRDALEQYSAFLFDRVSIEVDRSVVYSIEDRAGRFGHKPLVGSFRVRGPGPAEAFTFTLISVQIEPERAAAEVELLGEVYRKVRDDGRNEDDVIILGTLNADDRQLPPWQQAFDITPAITGIPTTTRGTRLADNILLNRRATAEFTGRSGVVDLIREFNLTMQQALEISEHLPVWAEFSVFEGGQPGHVSGGSGPAAR